MYLTGMNVELELSDYSNEWIIHLFDRNTKEKVRTHKIDAYMNPQLKDMYRELVQLECAHSKTRVDQDSAKRILTVLEKQEEPVRKIKR